MEREHGRPEEGLQDTPLPELRVDHIPEDVLAEEDAESRVADPATDPLAHLTGASDDVLTEFDAASRAADVGPLTPTDEEVLDAGPDEYERA
jgi:hypothetical protein